MARPRGPLSPEKLRQRRIRKLERYIERRQAWRDEQADNARWAAEQVAEADRDIAEARRKIEQLSQVKT